MSSTAPPGSTFPGAGQGPAGPPGPGGGSGGGTSEPQAGLPWEQRDQLGFLPAVVGTVKVVLVEPKLAFSSMRRSGGIGEPLIFTVLLGWVGGIVAIVWQTLISAIGPLLGAGQGLEKFGEQVILMAIVAILMPAFVAMGQFLWAAIVHLFAMMFGAANNGFEVTFRVTAYSYGSTAVWNVVPVIGGLVAFVWSIVASVIGLSQAQETTGGRAAAALLTPIVLGCVCVAGATGIVVALAVADNL